MLNIFQKKPILIFGLLLVALFYFYEYNRSIHYTPQGVHVWRQTDACSMTLNYYQYSKNFFTPTLHHLRADANTSGAGVSEAPIVYYIASLLYHVFGAHDVILRVLHMLIFFFGLFCLFHLLFQWFKDVWLSSALALMAFAAPVMVYYANNYLPNAPAFAIALAAWMFVFLYFQNKEKSKYLYWAVAMFALATLLKVTTGMNFLVFLGLIFLDFFDFFKKEHPEKLFPQKKKLILPIFIAFLSIVGWYLWAIHYNSMHHTDYFNNKTMSIFKLKKGEFGEYWNAIIDSWFSLYWGKEVWYISGIIFIWNCINIRKSNRLLTSIFFIFLLGSIFYSLLWFIQFYSHDYYFIDIYMVFVFNFFLFADTIQKNVKQLNYYTFRGFLFALLLSQIIYCRDENRKRYTAESKVAFADFMEVQPHLKEMGIKKTDRITSVGDDTNCASLYFMNTCGWTFSTVDDMHVIEEFRCKGAKYMVLNKARIQNSLEESIQKANFSLIGKFRNLYFYRIDGKEQKYVKLLSQKLVVEYQTECETFTPNNEKIMGSNGSLFDNTGLVIHENVHSGKNAVQLNKVLVYGFKFDLKGIEKYDKIEVSFWTRNSKGNDVIVCSSVNTSELYMTNANKANSNNEWEFRTFEFTINRSLQDYKVSIYVWNIKGDEVYYDDFSVKLFR